MSETQTPNPTSNPGAGADADEQRQVVLQKIFVRDASLEVPLAPGIFTRPWKPQIDVQVNTDVKTLQTDVYQVTLSLTVTAKLDDDVAFLVEAHQSGVVLVQGFNTDAERQAVLGAYCPNLIFPFARETVADLVQRAGFPQLLLQPLNFDALYLDHVKRAREQQQAAAPNSGGATAH